MVCLGTIVSIESVHLHLGLTALSRTRIYLDCINSPACVHFRMRSCVCAYEPQAYSTDDKAFNVNLETVPTIYFPSFYALKASWRAARSSRETRVRQAVSKPRVGSASKPTGPSGFPHRYSISPSFRCICAFLSSQRPRSGGQSCFQRCRGRLTRIEPHRHSTRLQYLCISSVNHSMLQHGSRQPASEMFWALGVPAPVFGR